VPTGSAQLCHYFYGPHCVRHVLQRLTNAQIPCTWVKTKEREKKKKGGKKWEKKKKLPVHAQPFTHFFKVSGSHSTYSRLDCHQSQAELSTHQHSLKRQWNSLGFKPTPNTRQMIKTCSSFMNASITVAIFAHTTDTMKPTLPHLLHTQYMLRTHTDALLCLQQHTVGSPSVFTLSRFFHLTHSSIRLMQMKDAEFSSYMQQNISLHATCISK
jgi:hypothetical protein